jgi:hypothetical protein
VPEELRELVERLRPELEKLQRLPVLENLSKNLRRITGQRRFGPWGASSIARERLLLDGRVVHDSPILSMCVSNTAVRTDAAGNRAPDQRKSTHRIDGCVALIMSLAMAPSAAMRVFDLAGLIGWVTNEALIDLSARKNPAVGC